MEVVPIVRATDAPKWRPLDRIARRVIGSLVEKAKTTPQQYPLTLNGLVTSCNQKSNRDPVMTLDAEQVDDALDRLRGLGCCVEVQGDSRAPKYRHTMYEWLGVDKVEMAVMTELLLRGAQTLGELRGRAARMDPIDDIAALRPILASLTEKKLIFYLTPPGRGAVVTHNLYEPQELDKVRAKHNAPVGGYTGDFADDGPERSATPAPAAAPSTTSSPAVSVAAPPQPVAASVRTASDAPAMASVVSNLAHQEELHALRQEVADLRGELATVRTELEELLEKLTANVDDIRQQLGC